MALIKHFAVTESKYFEFRAEAFNVFNHTEYSTGWAVMGAQLATTPEQGNADSTIVCYGGANNSAGDPSCVSSTGLTLLSAPRSRRTRRRILQLALKFIF